VGLRVISDSNTVDAYTSLTINYVPPTIHLVTPAPTWTLGVPYEIGFSVDTSGAVPVSDAITGWKIQWGDGTSSDLPSDATSAQHAYLSAQTFPIVMTVYDTYTNPNHLGLAPTATTTVTVVEGAQTINAGGPYTIHTG